MKTSDVVDSLNDAFRRDPLAMRLLMINMVECNADLSDHPTIQCWRIQGGYSVTALGLVNGVLGALGLPFVASKWNDVANEDGVFDFLGFVEYEKKADGA